MNHSGTPHQILAAASQSLRTFLPSTFSLAEASEKSDLAWAAQWRAHSHRSPPNGGWDWPKVRSSAGRAPSTLVIAMWCGQETELCGLSLMKLNHTACMVCMVEGSPNPHHLIKGMVLLVTLETAAMYAQGTGRRDVWIMGPIGDMVLHHLIQDYGFEIMAPGRGIPFCRKGV